MNTALNSTANHSHSMQVFKVQPRFAKFSYGERAQASGRSCLSIQHKLCTRRKADAGTIVKSNEQYKNVTCTHMTWTEYIRPDI